MMEYLIIWQDIYGAKCSKETDDLSEAKTLVYLLKRKGLDPVAYKLSALRSET